MLTQDKFLLESLYLALESNLFPEASLEDWVRDLLFLHSQGFLYGSFEPEDTLNVLACAWRLKEIPDKPIDQYPLKKDSDGNILYVSWIASNGNMDNLVLKRVLKSFLDQNDGVDTLCFFDLADGESRRIYSKLKKGEPNGIQEKAIVA